MALIIDAPMPPSCRWHNTNGRNTPVEICPYLQSCSAEFNIDAYRPSDCPIIGEIPDKHGELIDRDKASTQIIAEICQFCASADNGNCDGCLVQKCLEAIGRVTVIVEATE